MRQRPTPSGRLHTEVRFAQLYDEHGHDLLAYALRRTRNYEDAAEVLGETFLVAWRRGEAVPRGAEARLWLFGVARRVLANQRRGRRRASQLTERLKQELASAQPERLSDPNGGEALRALARLTEDDRELLLLVGWEELRPRDAARVLGISPLAARSRLHRARAHLRQVLAESEGDAQACGPTTTLGTEDA